MERGQTRQNQVETPNNKETSRQLRQGLEGVERLFVDIRFFFEMATSGCDDKAFLVKGSLLDREWHAVRGKLRMNIGLVEPAKDRTRRDTFSEEIKKREEVDEPALVFMAYIRKDIVEAVDVPVLLVMETDEAVDVPRPLIVKDIVDAVRSRSTEAFDVLVLHIVQEAFESRSATCPSCTSFRRSSRSGFSWRLRS